MTHVSFETLVDWWTGDLAAAEHDALELHLMGCDACTAEAERVGAVVRALRSMIPAFVSPAGVEALRARGLRIAETRFRPGQRKEVVFERHLDLLLHRLGGLTLRDAVSVGVVVASESTGVTLVAVPEVPFDRNRGEVLVACQHHFRDLPHDIVFRVTVRDSAGGAREEVFVVPHRFP